MSSSVRKIKNADKKSSLKIKRILKNKRKRARLYLLLGGILLLTLGFSFSKPSVKDSSVSSGISEINSFSTEPVTIDKALLEKSDIKKKDELSPQRIIVPSLEIDLPVRQARVINGYWEVFDESAGFGIGSSYPGEKGNQVIFAHARQGLFLPLKKAKTGQKIMVLTKDKWYEYEIKEIKEVSPSQTETIAPTEEETLTLYTCSGFSDSKRLIVIAKRIN